MAVTGRKRTLFHSKWANSMSYISRMLYWNHSRFSVSLYEWLNSTHSKFQSHSYWQSLVIAVWISITPPTLMFVFYLWLPHLLLAGIMHIYICCLLRGTHSCTHIVYLPRGICLSHMRADGMWEAYSVCMETFKIRVIGCSFNVTFVWVSPFDKQTCLIL